MSNKDQSWELTLDSLGIEKAPESLRKKLRDIPKVHKGTNQSLWHWGVITSAALVLIIVLLVDTKPVSDSPSDLEIEKARLELIVAFNYLQSVGEKTNKYMKREIGGSMKNALIKGIYYGVSKESGKS